MSKKLNSTKDHEVYNLTHAQTAMVVQPNHL